MKNPISKRDINQARKTYNRKLKEVEENDKHFRALQILVFAWCLLTPLSYIFQPKEEAFERVASAAITFAVLFLLRKGVYFVGKQELKRLDKQHEDLIFTRKMHKRIFGRLDCFQDPRFEARINFGDVADWGKRFEEARHKDHDPEANWDRAMNEGDEFFKERLVALVEAFKPAFCTDTAVQDIDLEKAARGLVLWLLNETSLSMDKLEELLIFVDVDDIRKTHESIGYYDAQGMSAKAIATALEKYHDVKLKISIREQQENETNKI